jgi:hypothetical protein
MFDWRDNLELAQRLGAGNAGGTVSIHISDATNRCAVGRAYYASFGHARAYAVQYLGFLSTGGAGDHGLLAAHFRQHGMRQVAHLLGRLRRRRNQCDYDDIVPRLPTMVSDSIREAAAVINRL